MRDIKRHRKELGGCWHQQQPQLKSILQSNWLGCWKGHNTGSILAGTVDGHFWGPFSVLDTHGPVSVDVD